MGIMNQAMKARILVLVFWALGMPLIVLSFVAIPRALDSDAVATRLMWIFVPVLGLLVAISCIRTLLRMDARAGGAAFDRFWLGRYYVEILVAFMIYLALFAVALKIAPTVPDPGVRMLVGLAPVLGMALILIAIVRWVRRADEYHRERLLESFAATAAITALWASGYSFLEGVGFPKLNMFWIPMSMMATWAAWSIGRAILGR
jgi:hypothetical protein